MKQTLPPYCLILDTLEFQGKQPLMDYLNRYKLDIENTRIESQRSAPIDVVYEEDSLHYIFPLVNFWLKREGFKPVSDEEFRSKVKEIYNLDILIPDTKFEKANNYYLFVSKIYTEPYGPHLGYTYFIKDGNFIFRPTLDEYLAKITEDRQYYTCLKQSTLHQNKFLFNDSNASLTWLINNDMEFLEMLVREFGYDKNEKINKAVLESINDKYLSSQPRDRKVLINLFAKKDCMGNLQIRENIMKYISDSYNQENDTPLEMLYTYASAIADIEPASEEALYLASDFTKEERFMIAAYAGYYGQLARNRNSIDGVDDSYYKPTQEGWLPGSFLRNELVGNNEFLEVIKENDYYGLLDFENIISDILMQIESQSEEYKRTH